MKVGQGPNWGCSIKEKKSCGSDKDDNNIQGEELAHTAGSRVQITIGPVTQSFRNPLWFPAMSLVLNDAERSLDHSPTCAWQQIIASHST
jgi:hypothetical protein